MGGGTETQGTGLNNAGAMGLYDPNYGYGDPAGSTWGVVGSGLQNLGTGVSRAYGGYGSVGQTVGQQSGYTSTPPTQQEAGAVPLIPQQDNQYQELIAIIQRLFGGRL